MTIQEHLAVFDGWLTRRITEACDANKDLAFRDLVSEDGRMAEAWEHRLLDPGQHSPAGEGWSVYRLQGVWPDFSAADPAHKAAETAVKPNRSAMSTLATALFGQLPAKMAR